MQETENFNIEWTPAERARQEFARLAEAHEDELGRLRRQLVSVEKRVQAQALVVETLRACAAELNDA